MDGPGPAEVPGRAGAGRGRGGGQPEGLFPAGAVAGTAAAGGRTEVAPGAVHLPGWLSPERQRELVAACRAWARGPVPMRHTRLPGGGTMSARTLCLGWHWRPYRYTRTADDVNGARVAELPEWLAGLGRAAVAEAYGEDGGGYVPEAPYAPDTALVNYYGPDARMGMHQDREERSAAPVVSLSLGDSCVFRFGNPESRGRPWTDLELGSGDLFVFGGPSRLAYHGVVRIRPGTADPALGLADGGRLNITLRVTGLTG